jgi:sulfur-oxidizing protein SoxY
VVSVPSIVENQAQVPVTADARALAGITKLMIFADLNPIQHVLTLSPDGAQAYIAFRLKVEQATPVRAAALAADGVWHVGSVYLDAAGGGCSAPALARKDADWSVTIGQSQGRIWRGDDGTARLKLRVRHPMDTGLAKDGTPAFYIDQTDIKDASGRPLARLDLFEPVAEDPTVTLMLKLPASETSVTVDGRDNNGGIFRATIPAPWKSSALAGQ